ncbi:MAG: RDD family protein [Bacteroidota bacterium]
MHNTETPIDLPGRDLGSFDPRERMASKGKRFANHLIDSIMFYIIAFALGAFLALSGNVHLVDDELTLNLIMVGAVLAYYVLCESISGKTLGKAITRTRVVAEDGTKPGTGKIIGRTLCRAIPFDAFSFLFGERGWHDSISGTYVVDDK